MADHGGMPLQDAVGINCKRGPTTKNQGSAVKYIGQGVYLDDCVCVLSDLADYPPWCREKVIVYDIIIHSLLDS